MRLTKIVVMSFAIIFFQYGYAGMVVDQTVPPPELQQQDLFRYATNVPEAAPHSETHSSGKYFLQTTSVSSDKQAILYTLINIRKSGICVYSIKWGGWEKWQKKNRLVEEFNESMAGWYNDKYFPSIGALSLMMALTVPSKKARQKNVQLISAELMAPNPTVGTCFFNFVLSPDALAGWKNEPSHQPSLESVVRLPAPLTFNKLFDSEDNTQSRYIQDVLLTALGQHTF